MVETRMYSRSSFLWGEVRLRWRGVETQIPLAPQSLTLFTSSPHTKQEHVPLSGSLEGGDENLYKRGWDNLLDSIWRLPTPQWIFAPQILSFECGLGVPKNSRVTSSILELVGKSNFLLWIKTRMIDLCNLELALMVEWEWKSSHILGEEGGFS
jgi:hypothetical protein